MKRAITLTILASILLPAIAPSADLNADATKNLTSMPLAFTKNQGQWDERVLFRADAGGTTQWFTRDGAYYQFTRKIDNQDCEAESHDPQPGRFDGEYGNFEMMTIRATIVDANLNARIAGQNELEYRCNYLIGNDPAGWRTDVPNYDAVVYHDIYPGIDLKYYSNGAEMEYDFIVSPGADPSLIRVRYEGIESLSISGEDELVVSTEWGEVVERRLVMFHSVGDMRLPVEGRYELIAGNTFGFSPGDGYDPGLPLVIDPVLSYSTHLGGSDADWGQGVAVDDDGAAYVIGHTYSTDFPIANTSQELNGNLDVFVTKLNSSGNDLIYSTYLGGVAYEWGLGIVVDATGAAFVTGFTCSPDFPTVSALQGAYQGGSYDGFVAKLNAEGNDLSYSTYLGGSGEDRGYDIAVDGFGMAYVTGGTYSPDFPAEGGYQEAHQGNSDAFVTKLASAGNTLAYSTYLGGSGEDCGFAITVDAATAAVVTGQTHSADFPIFNAYQPYQGGDDVFVTKLTDLGSSVSYSTYLGGTGNECGYGVAVDALGSACVTGKTSSTDLPVSGAHQEEFQGGNSDAFVMKLSSTGTNLPYSSYFGGSGSDYGTSIDVDGSASMYLTGYTNSSNFPTLDPLQTSQGDFDAFVTWIRGSDNSLLASSYLGGTSDDRSFDIAVSSGGAVFVAGYTVSSDFPVFNHYQTNQGIIDAFVTKLTHSCCQVPGDANDDGQVDIADFQYLRDYLNKSGPEPPCFEQADVNGDGEITKEDMSCLARYLFSGGNPCVFVECP